MFRYSLLLLTFFLLAGCASRSVVVDFNTSFDFSTLRDFQFADAKPEELSLPAQRIIEQLSRELTAKGYTLNPASSDFIVALSTAQRQEPNDTRLSIGLGTGTWGRSGGISIGGAVSVPVGEEWKAYQWAEVRMVVDEKVVWRGQHSVKLGSNTPEAMQQAQRELISEILASFPTRQQ